MRFTQFAAAALLAIAPIAAEAQAAKTIPEVAKAAGTVQDLLKPENREKLKGILLYHVVSGKVNAATASTLTSAATVGGQNLKIMKMGNGLMINEATVKTADVMASNGIIHVIDRVLLPPAK